MGVGRLYGLHRSVACREFLEIVSTIILTSLSVQSRKDFRSELDVQYVVDEVFRLMKSLGRYTFAFRLL